MIQLTGLKSIGEPISPHISCKTNFPQVVSVKSLLVDTTGEANRVLLTQTSHRCQTLRRLRDPTSVFFLTQGFERSLLPPGRGLQSSSSGGGKAA